MTLQEQYNQIKNGEGSKYIFLTEAKKQFPNILTNPMGFEETSKMLKTRGVITENYVDLYPISVMEATEKLPFEIKYAEFLAEEAKSVEKKTTKEVDEVNAHGFNNKDKSNLDNQIGQEVLNGIYFEAKQNPDKDLEEIRKIVSKNLEKDGQYYMKNAAFGIEGLGYQETEVEEVSGKHKSSGYSDKLKKLVKESLMRSLNNPLKESNEFGGMGLIVRGKTPQDNDLIDQAIEESGFYGIYNSQEDYWFFPEEGDQSTMDKLENELETIFIQKGADVSYEGQFNESLKEETQIEETPKPDFADIDGDGDKEEPVKTAAKDKKKMKKDTLESRLAEIDKQGAVVALEAKIEMVGEAIETKNSRISMISEDENLSELVDKNKIKAMQREVKTLENQKAKMEKVYEKMCGKTYSKMEVVGEVDTDESI